MEHELSEKQPWVQPRLVLLGRGNPEEAVLAEICYSAVDNECTFEGGEPMQILSGS